MSDQARTALESALELEQSHDFEQAKGIYADILANAAADDVLEKARWRMEDMDDLIAEKSIYRRIDELEKTRAESRTIMIPHPLYPWTLGLGMLVLLGLVFWLARELREA